jgi:hypothetical protein
MDDEDLVYRLRKRAEIRRQITTRKSVQEGKPDRIADLLEEAATEIQTLEAEVRGLQTDKAWDLFYQERDRSELLVAEAAKLTAERDEAREYAQSEKEFWKGLAQRYMDESIGNRLQLDAARDALAHQVHRNHPHSPDGCDGCALATKATT